jgi:hypothetical protein
MRYVLGLLITNSAQEQEIIEHLSSCYVIGRSGTGKTTTMLFKMLGIQRTWQQYPDMGPKPRQVFITQSRILATKVEEYFAKLMWALEASAYSPEELRMMDKEIEQEIDFVDQDDNDQWRSDLPERFSELLDEHFPLFITYDRVRISVSEPEHLSHHYVNSCARCFRTTSSEATIMMVLLSPRCMSSRMRQRLPRVQHSLRCLGCERGLGVHPHLTTCNNSVETSSPTASSWRRTGITSPRPLPES